MKILIVTEAYIFCSIYFRAQIRINFIMYKSNVIVIALFYLFAYSILNQIFTIYCLVFSLFYIFFRITDRILQKKMFKSLSAKLKNANSDKL